VETPGVSVVGKSPTPLERREVLALLSHRELVTRGGLELELGGEAFSVTELGRQVAIGEVAWPAPVGAAVAADNRGRRRTRVRTNPFIRQPVAE
jgi:hypothetical protein